MIKEQSEHRKYHQTAQIALWFITFTVVAAFSVTSAIVWQHGKINELQNLCYDHINNWQRILEQTNYLGDKAELADLPPHILLKLQKNILVLSETVEEQRKLIKEAMNTRSFYFLTKLLMGNENNKKHALNNAKIEKDVILFIKRIYRTSDRLLQTEYTGSSPATLAKLQSTRALSKLKKRYSILRALSSKSVHLIWYQLTIVSIFLAISMWIIWYRFLFKQAKELSNTYKNLARNEGQLSATLNSIGDGVITTDLKGKIISLNSVGATLTGWHEEEARHRSLSEVWHIIDTTKDGEGNLALSLSRSNKTKLFGTTTALRSKNGHLYHISVSTSPILSKDQVSIGMVFVFRDVSEFIGIQRKLNSQKRLQALGQLAGGIAHDFNNILGIVIGNASFAIKMDAGDTNSQQRFNAILKAGRSGKDLIDRLLSFSPNIDTLSKPFLLSDVCHEIVEFTNQSNSVSPSIRIDCSQNVHVRVDRTLLTSAMLNILINAIDACGPDGEISILINVHLRGQKTFATISIEDNGPGIPQKHMEHVLEPFFTTKADTGGKGLGLATVEAFTVQSGGELIIQSNPNEGTRIELNIPCLKPI